MSFDIKTARPIEEVEGKKTGFDITTARPYVEEEEKPLSYQEERIQKEKERRARLEKTPLGKTAYSITDYFYPQFMTGKEFREGEHNILGDIFTRPARAIRSAILPKEGENRLQAYMRGAVSSPEPKNIVETITDIAVDPTNYLLGAFGLAKKAQIGGMAKTGLDKFIDIGKTINTKAEQAMSYPLKSGKTIGQVFENIKKPANFAEKLRSKFYQVHTNAVNKFGNQLDELAKLNPDRAVSLRDTVDDILLNLNDMPLEAKSALRRTPKLSQMLDNPELANNVSLRDAQDIINYLNNKIPTNIKSKHIDILETLNDVRASQLDAFPEMANIRAEYRTLIEPYKNLKNYFKFNKVLKAIESNFGGAEGIKALKMIFPKEVIKEIGGYRNAIKILKGFGIIGAGGLGYAGYKLGKSFLQ